MKLKKKQLQVHQFAFDTKNLEQNNEEKLDICAPIIGYIIQNFNALEQLLNSTICELFHDDYDILGLIVIQKLNFSSKVDLFKRILLDIQNGIEREIPILEELVQKLNESAKLRNTVVHSDWESSHIDGYTMTKTIINKKGFQYEYTQFTEESLENILDLIIETYNLFDTFEEQYSELLCGN